MTKQQRADIIIERLEAAYPGAKCGLSYAQPWQLLVTVRLSAQCTDERVNIVSKELFSCFPSAEALAGSSPEEIERIIRPCGLGATKARDIFLAMNKLISNYNGQIPSTMDELLKIPGVGRKSANLILGEVFSLPAIVVDTHCIRLANRLGLCDSLKPNVIERELRSLIPDDKGADFCHRLILFGRQYCSARSPECNICFLRDVCVHPAYKDLSSPIDSNGTPSIPQNPDNLQ